MAPRRGRSRQGASEEAATGQGLLARGAHGRAPPPAQCPGQPQGEAPVRRYRPSTKEETEGQRGSRGGPRTHGWGRQSQARRPGRLTRACTPTHLATHAGMPGLSHPVSLLHGTAHLPVTFTTWSRRGRAPESGHIQGPEMATAQPRVVS